MTTDLSLRAISMTYVRLRETVRPVRETVRPVRETPLRLVPDTVSPTRFVKTGRVRGTRCPDDAAAAVSDRLAALDYGHAVWG